MIEVTQWWKQFDGAQASWLLLGKGPSFSRRDEFDLKPFRTIALNHAVREMPVDVASAVDIDVVRDCAEHIERNAKFLLMPRYPHFNHDSDGSVKERALETYFDELPVLRRLSDAGRLVWYNLSTGQEVTDSPRIPSAAFSAGVMVQLLGRLGAHTIRTLGVDGGTEYASQFADLNQSTRLSNGKKSFDEQFTAINNIIREFQLDYAPLANDNRMRIYIGTDETQMLGARLFEYSVLKYSTLTPLCNTMMQVRVPMPKDPKNQPRTNFSFNRFAIPQLNGYKGRAVYVDADMQVFRDFRELWETPFEDATVLHCATSDPNRPRQFSVMLLDCERLRWDPEEIVRGLDEKRYDYDQLMKEFCIVPPEQIRAGLSSDWNSLEHYEAGKTGLIHYTDMHTQPWVYGRNKNGNLWVDDFRDAVRSGFVSTSEVNQALKNGNIRPSLLWQVFKVPRRLWPQFNKTLGRVIDKGYKPHQQVVSRLSNKAAA